MIRDDIRKMIIEAFGRANLGYGVTPEEVSVESIFQSSYGDYASNAGLVLAKKIKLRPQDLARILKDNISNQLGSDQSLITGLAVADPGFLNFFLSPEILWQQVREILSRKEKYGSSSLGQNQKVEVEFISANPTGPLTVGNARGGFWGDVLANVLKSAGFKVEKDYYVNDYGNQILTLGHSVLKDEEAKYKGDYIDWLAGQIKEKDPYRVGEAAAKLVIEKMIKPTVLKMGIKYDNWLSETSFHKSRRVDKVIERLKKKDLVYEKEGAWWFKSTLFGDPRDRVIVKGNEWKTYLAGDMALHQYKFEEKKFNKVINIWGADHYGDVPGLQAVVQALGHAGKLEVILLQFVTLFEKGEQFKMSKRLGNYVTMDELLETVGLAAARFFFLQKSPDTHLNFDMDLAKEPSDKNPVYYVQYAYARSCSIFAKIKSEKLNLKPSVQDLKLLNHESELNLIKQLLRLPEVVEDTAKDYQAQRLPQYALDLAASFHQFYRDCHVVLEDKKLSQARLALVQASRIVLKNALDLLGIPAPEKM